MKKVKIKDIIDILGIEQENIKNYDTRLLKKEFNALIMEYDEDQIWLKEDYGDYVKGKILTETTFLYAIDCL